MPFVPYDSAETARTRSAAFATHLGCGQQPEDVTRYWYAAVERPVVEDPENPSPLPAGVDAALDVPADDVLDALIRADQLTADEYANLLSAYPTWTPNTPYASGAFARYRNDLFEIIQPHTSQTGWEPPNVPALWVKRTPPGVVGVWVQPLGAHDAYPLGARVIHPVGGPLWESTTAANVWAPGVFGWVEVPE